VQSRAETVDGYLVSLPDERRAIVAAVRDVVLSNLPEGYEEGIQYGMIGWYVPHVVYPAGYHADPSQPVPFAALASQKRYVSLYLMGLYCGCGEDVDGETLDARWFREAWLATGRKLDMGRSCVRFRRLEDVPLEVVAEAIRRVPVSTYLERYEEVLGQRASGRSRRSPG
jgi:hypothetical protein